jgi:hypothetical protein
MGEACPHQRKRGTRVSGSASDVFTRLPAKRPKPPTISP